MSQCIHTVQMGDVLIQCKNGATHRIASRCPTLGCTVDVIEVCDECLVDLLDLVGEEFSCVECGQDGVPKWSEPIALPA